MKRFFVCAVLFAAMFLTVSCGGGSSDDNNSGGSSETSVCSYGTYECHGNDSYFCGYGNGNDLMWSLYEQCSNGCDSWTGKCDRNSGGGSGDYSGGGSSECTDGQRGCKMESSGDSIYYCKDGRWIYKCKAKYSCLSAPIDEDVDTFECADNSENSEDTEPEHICDNGEYSCSGNARMKCQSNSWVFSETCANGCSNGECNSCTPQCNGKECGLDGCGGTCGSCDSGYDCTPAGECVRNNGCSEHEDCTDEGMICYQNYCQSPWNKMWKITFEEAKVSEKDGNGDTWDVPGGLPDLFATVEKNGVKIYQTKVVGNSTTATWNQSTTINFQASTDKIRYCLYDDDDVSNDERVGCWDHEFELFTYEGINFYDQSGLVDHFYVSLEPAW